MRYFEIVEHAGSEADKFDYLNGHAFAIAVSELKGFPIFAIKASGSGKVIAVAAKAGDDAFITPLGQLSLLEILQRQGRPDERRPELQQVTPSLVRTWSRHGVLKPITSDADQRARELATDVLTRIGYA